MKATNNDLNDLPESKEVEKKKATTELALLNEKQIDALFVDLVKKSEKLVEQAREVKVTDDATLVVAETSSAKINDLLKSIDKVRKENGQPYFDVKKAIDEKAKQITNPLESAKDIVNATIQGYRTIQKQKAAIEAEKILKEEQDRLAEKGAEYDRLMRIKTMIYAKMYGGSYTVANGLTKSSAGCLSVKDCDDLMKSIEMNFPLPKDFKYLSEESELLKSELIKDLFAHKANVIAGDHKKIANSRIDSSIAINTDRDKFAEEIEKESKKVEKTVEKTISQAGKGLRKTVTFDVWDLSIVPVQFVELNSTEVRKYMNENLDEIKKAIEIGNEEPDSVIPGIRFRYEESYAVR